MPHEKLDGRQQLEAVLEALGQHIEATTDEEFLEQAKDSGENLDAISRDVKSVFQNQLRAFRRLRRDAVRHAYQARVEAHSASRRSLPKTFDEKRALLDAVLASRPQFREMLTAQHRNFSNLTDEDLDSYLEELSDLGVLDEIED